jgi:hypothetical protein
MPELKRNIAASARARLLKLARERNQPNDLLLTRYVLERLLYRLSTTKHRERFVLKGAMLMTTWFEDPSILSIAFSTVRMACRIRG